MADDNQIGWVEVGVRGEPKLGSYIHGNYSRWFVAECFVGVAGSQVTVYDYLLQSQVKEHLARAGNDSPCQAIFYGVVMLGQVSEYMTYPNLPSSRLKLYGHSELEPLDWVPLVMNEITALYDVLMGLDKS